MMNSTPRYANVSALIPHLKSDETVNCLCPDVLHKHVTFFKTAFSGTVAYAVKANPTPLLIEEITKAGTTHFDVASVTEIAMVRRIQPDAVLLYDNPIKSRLELSQAYNDFKVRSFAIDDAIELQKINDVVGEDSSIEISIRFGIGGSSAVYDLGTKFGADEETSISLLKQIDSFGYKAALTFHPGSQCLKEDAYNSHIAAAARIEKQADISIVMLNVGGGFPTDYPNSGAPKLAGIFNQISETFQAHFPERNIELVCEPGRALADPAISTLTHVKHRRVEPIVFLNNGIYGDFMEQMLAHIEIPTRVYRGADLLKSKTLIPFKVFGPTCDSLDIFSYDVPLPAEIAENDWIEFADMGGYGSSSSTGFNGYYCGSYVLVDEGFESEAFRANLT